MKGSSSGAPVSGPSSRALVSGPPKTLTKGSSRVSALSQQEKPVYEVRGLEVIVTATNQSRLEKGDAEVVTSLCVPHKSSRKVDDAAKKGGNSDDEAADDAATSPTTGVSAKLALHESLLI